MRKLKKKRIIITLEIKICLLKIEKEYTSYYNRKIFLNHLINRIEELENLNLNK